MTEPSELTTLPNLSTLMEGLPDTEVTRTTRTMSNEEFERQQQKVLQLGSNARVIGAIVEKNDTRIGLVRREGSHAGWALPSGTVDPGETFASALPREIGEELGVGLLAGSTALMQVEERIFLNGNGESQRVFLATFFARVALGQSIHQTPRATAERLRVGSFALSSTALPPIPKVLAFNDGAKIAAVRQFYAA